MNLYFVTSNLHKVHAAQRIIPSVKQLDNELTEIQHLDPKRVILHKLQEACQFTNEPVIVEDSALSIACLQGLPGTFIKWFLSTLGPAGIYNLVSRYSDHRATASVIVGYVAPHTTPQFFSGEIKGTVVAPRGSDGFGYDVIFQPQNLEKTLGQLQGDSYDAASPRTIAFVKLRDYLLRERLI